MDNKKALIWLKKARTTLDKVIDMIEKDIYCIDIIQQNLAVIWLLKSSNLTLLEGHLNCCFKNAIKNKDNEKLDKMILELLKVVNTAQSK